MKYIVPVLALFVFACSEGPSETDLEKVGLNGPVAKLTEKTSKAVMEEGKLVETKTLSVDEYTYNAEGYVQHWNYTVPAFYYAELYDYDDQGNPMTVTIIEGPDSSQSHCELKMHKNGMVAVETWFDQEGKLEFHYDNSYEKNRLVETKAYDQDDSLRSIRRFSYNDEGLQDSILSYSPENELQQFTAKTFQNKWVKTSKVHALQLQTPENLAMINSYDYVELDEHNNWVKAFLVTENKRNNETVYRIISRKIEYAE